jgi:two-component system response regulator AtoC
MTFCARTGCHAGGRGGTRDPGAPLYSAALSQEDISAAGRSENTAGPPPSPYQLVIFSGEDIRTFDLPATGEVTIGRGEENVLRIDDQSVSRSHAVLRVGPALEIEDLGGANGIFLREKIGAGSGKETLHLNIRQLVRKKAKLAVGDSILFGSTSVVLRRAPRIEVPDLEVSAMPGVGAGVVVRDPAMRALYEQAARAARSQLSILLLGETGVGKEVLARAIHKHSARSQGPFVGMNCAAFAESLLESDLFGCEKGAFTGALQARAGLFEAANGGTVFLDEVGELPPSTQAKLLRVLEERVVTRLGSTRPRPIDVRFLSATNRDIEADSGGGRFRQDLYFRLAGISLSIPPLRERPREIELLVTAFVAAACRQIDRALPLAVSPAALDRLRAHAWPGNVRELRNVIERATVLCTGDTILPEHLPPSLLKSSQSTPPGPGSAAATKNLPPGEPLAGAKDLQVEIKSLERARIVEALERCAGNQSQAAELLGISRGTLISRLAEFGLHRPRKRPV